MKCVQGGSAHNHRMVDDDESTVIKIMFTDGIHANNRSTHYTVHTQHKQYGRGMEFLHSHETDIINSKGYDSAMVCIGDFLNKSPLSKSNKPLWFGFEVTIGSFHEKHDNCILTKAFAFKLEIRFKAKW